MENTVENLLKRQRILVVIIGILLFITLTSLVYAFVQKGIANENLQEAKRQEALAKENAIEALRQARMAQEATRLAEENEVRAAKAAAEAKLQNQRAQDALKKISKK